MFNYSNHIPLIKLLKEGFPGSSFYFVIHYQNWCFSLNGDVVHFKQIIHSNDISTLSSLEQKFIIHFSKRKNYIKLLIRLFVYPGLLFHY